MLMAVVRDVLSSEGSLCDGFRVWEVRDSPLPPSQPVVWPPWAGMTSVVPLYRDSASFLVSGGLSDCG